MPWQNKFFDDAKELVGKIGGVVEAGFTKDPNKITDSVVQALDEVVNVIQDYVEYKQGYSPEKDAMLTSAVEVAHQKASDHIKDDKGKIDSFFSQAKSSIKDKTDNMKNYDEFRQYVSNQGINQTVSSPKEKEFKDEKKVFADVKKEIGGLSDLAKAFISKNPVLEFAAVAEVVEDTVTLVKDSLQLKKDNDQLKSLTKNTIKVGGVEFAKNGKQLESNFMIKAASIDKTTDLDGLNKDSKQIKQGNQLKDLSGLKNIKEISGKNTDAQQHGISPPSTPSQSQGQDGGAAIG